MHSQKMLQRLVIMVCGILYKSKVGVNGVSKGLFLALSEPPAA